MRLIPLLLLFGLSACASAAPDSRVFTYVCASGQSVRAEFNAAGDSVAVSAGGVTRVLPQQVSASGARFSDGTAQLWSKGKDAMIEGLPGGPFVDCRTP